MELAFGCEKGEEEAPELSRKTAAEDSSIENSFGACNSHSDHINSANVIDVLAEAMIEHGIPEYIRSDNGPEFVAKELRKWLRRLLSGGGFFDDSLGKIPWPVHVYTVFESHEVGE